MERKFLAVVAAVGMLAVAASQGRAQSGMTTEGCTLVKTTYQCDAKTMRGAVRHAETVSFDTEPHDEAAKKNLQQLAEFLHKRVVERGDADLILSLRPMNSNGVVIGPRAEDMGRLNVLKAGHGGEENQLVWSEVFSAETDRPWPLAANALVEQFEERFRR